MDEVPNTGAFNENHSGTWQPLDSGGGRAILPATEADRRYNLR
jgi:hypothetical protein